MARNCTNRPWFFHKQSHNGTADCLDRPEPPVNPFVADSPWPMSHANPYCQASSLYPGPTEDTSEYKFDYLGELMYYPPITVAISGAYPDGNRVLWGNTPTTVFKAGLDGDKLSYVEKMEKEPLNVTLSHIECGLSNAYTLVDCEGTFFVPSIRKIFGYGDEVPGDPYSKIITKRVLKSLKTSFAAKMNLSPALILHTMACSFSLPIKRLLELYPAASTRHISCILERTKKHRIQSHVMKMVGFM